MKLFADTNWLKNYYFSGTKEHVICLARMERHDHPLVVSSPVLLECRTVFPRVAREANPPELVRLESDLGSRLMDSRCDWNALERRCSKRQKKYKG